MDWEITLLPMDETFIKGNQKLNQKRFNEDMPCNFFKGTFQLTKTGDTYFDLSKYSKGVLYVNGHNLGRYWNIGPQQRLYCPASWLKKGENELLLFDFFEQESKTIEGFKTIE